MTRRARALLVLGLAALPLAACGRKGRPVAPEARAPQAVLDLAGVVREAAIELTWTLPGRRADNTRLRQLGQARVFRVDDAGTGEPKPALLADGRIAGYTEVASIRLDTPGPQVEDRRVTFADRRGLALARRYTYVVLTSDAPGRISPPSRRVSVTFIAAPEPPAGLAAVAGDAEVRLAWRAPARLVDGSAPSGDLVYEVLRAAAADATPLPLPPGPVPAPALIDRGLENDRTYYYAVRAVRTFHGTTAYGAATSPVAVTPRDTTPPSPPANLAAIPSEGAVRLSWSPSPEPDVAGYVVYRAAADGGFVRIGATRAPTTVFVDRDAPSGRHRYAVTAQDGAARPNESARSSEARVTVP